MSNDYDPSEMEPGQNPEYQRMLLQYFLGMGGLNIPGVSTQPSLYPAQIDSMTGAVPPSLNPTQQGNYLQDYLDIMFDDATAAMYGSGAYSPDAFAPEVTYTPVAQPGLQQLQYYMQSPGSIEAFIAEQIMNGATSSQAIEELRQAYEADPENEEAANLVNQLPLWRDEMGEYTPDWGGAQDQARSMEQLLLNDPMPGAQQQIIDPQTGEVIGGGGEIVQGVDAQGNPVMMRVESEDSPMAEWYRERGLSLPTDEYTPEDFLGQQWQQGRQQFDALNSQWKQEYQQWLASLSPEPERYDPLSSANPGSLPGSELRESGEMLNENGQVIYDPLSSANPGSRVMAQNERQATQPDYYDPLSSGQPSQAYLDNQYAGTPSDPWIQTLQDLDAQYAAGLDEPRPDEPEAPPSEQPAPDWLEAAIMEAAGQGGQRYDPLSSANPGSRPRPLPEWASVLGEDQGEEIDWTPAGRVRPMRLRRPMSDDDENPLPRSEGVDWYPRNPVPLSERNQMAANDETRGRSAEQQRRFQQQAMLEQVLRFGTSDTEPTDEERRNFRRTNPATARISGDAPSNARRGTFNFEGRDRVMRARDQTYGADYGRAVATAWLLKQQGVTPLQQQLAARRQVPIGMGLVGSGYLPGVG